ncbi:MAG: lysine--tRNA ligase [Acidobacteria bacterium]|nr:lysine--tRNA ligase [Acidobacteriota bacterium]
MPFEPLDQYLQRQKKLKEIAALGHDPYPREFRFTHTPGQILNLWNGKSHDELEAEKPQVRVAGRLMTIRGHGKAGFAHLQGEGKQIQIYVKKDVVGDQGFQLYQLFDMGDIVGVAGRVFRTKTNELTIWVEELTLLTKALLPLPEKWHGLADVEARYRQRYLDLIANEGVRDLFLKRSQIIREVRKFFDARGYVEVETPMLHPIFGGATARPFITHHNVLDQDMYLRIAPELYLKRLVVGGLDRVYEINRNFRNEGIGYRWNPEFTMLEFYQAYSNYRDLMDLTEELVTEIVKNVCGALQLPYGEHTVDFAKWERMTLREAVSRYWPPGAGIAPTVAQLASPESVQKSLDEYNAWANRTHAGDPLHPPRGAGAGWILAGLFEVVAEKHLINPTIIYDYPTEVSPLAKKRPDDPTLTERFEFFAGGRLELGNGFSELNDPEDQEARFREQIARGGDEVPRELDVDYIRALCHALPPTAGEGIGIDRLTMLLTNSHSIREVILFPLLRPEAAAHANESESGAKK